jgi:hypothetical protein
MECPRFGGGMGGGGHAKIDSNNQDTAHNSILAHRTPAIVGVDLINTSANTISTTPTMDFR